MDEDEEMILFNHRVESEESGVVEEGKGTELEPLNPPVPTETANRATASDEETIGRDGGSGDMERGEAGTENVENVSARGDGVRVRCRI